MSVLSIEQVDVLKEIFNLGMGRALNSLSKLTDARKEIYFTIPEIEIIDSSDFVSKFSEGTGNVFVSQKYDGDIKGESMMFFLDTSRSEIAQLLIDSSLPVEEICRLESDALVEIGNIFINAAISCLADFLEVEIHTEIPELLTEDIIQKEYINRGPIIFLDSTFSVDHDSKLKGQVAFLVNNATLEHLMRKIDEAY